MLPVTAEVSLKTRALSILPEGQFGAKPGQDKGAIRSDLIEDFKRVFPLWKEAVEKRPGGISLLSGDEALKSTVKRTQNPKSSVRMGTWCRGLQRVLSAIEALWNTSLAEGENKLHLDWETFLNPPKDEALFAQLMRPEQAADLTDAPKVSDAAMKHLYRYFQLTRKRVARAEIGARNILEERNLREAIASAAEALRLWSYADQELQQLAAIHVQLKDQISHAQILLRRGIVLYRMEAFREALNILETGVALLEEHAPDRAIRTEIKLWDYLGLCHARLGNPHKALEVLENPAHQRRIALLPAPLADASRHVRVGIALLMLKKISEAREHCVRAADIRIRHRAYPEAARAFRYVGRTYFEEGRFHEALVIWDRCVWVQRAHDDEHEEMKLYFFLGQLFEKLIGQESARMNSIHIADTFLSDAEKGLLIDLAEDARSPGSEYHRDSFAKMARIKYDQCLQIAEVRNCAVWAKGAKSAIQALNVSMAVNEPERRTSRRSRSGS